MNIFAELVQEPWLKSLKLRSMGILSADQFKL